MVATLRERQFGSQIRTPSPRPIALHRGVTRYYPLNRKTHPNVMNQYSLVRLKFPALAASCAALQIASQTFAATVNWPQFRGPNSSGVSDDATPTTWNAETG